MPYTINRNKTLGLTPHDPPKDPDRVGRLQREYINARYPELWKALNERRKEDGRTKS